MTAPSSPSPSTAKVCIRCGRDCSKRARTKDQQGRYTCRECFDAAQSEQAIVMEPPGAGGASRRSPSEHRIEPAAPVGADGDGGVLALEGEGDDAMYSMLLEGAAQAAARVTTSPCPGCGLPLKSDAALCVSCGYNAKTGKVVSTKEGKAEVAKPLPGADKARARQRERELSAWAMKMEYIKPVIMMLVGLTITCVLLGQRNDGAERIVFYLMAYAVSIPVTVGAFLLCCSLWIGFDAPITLVTIRLAGITAIVDILLFGVRFGVFGGIGVIGFRYLLPLLVFTALLMHLMDMDYEDALLAGIITGLLRIVGTIFLLMWIANTLGGG